MKAIIENPLMEHNLPVVNTITEVVGKFDTPEKIRLALENMRPSSPWFKNLLIGNGSDHVWIHCKIQNKRVIVILKD